MWNAYTVDVPDLGPVLPLDFAAGGLALVEPMNATGQMGVGVHADFKFGLGLV